MTQNITNPRLKILMVVELGYQDNTSHGHDVHPKQSMLEAENLWEFP